jgi:hypothetical protein
VLDYYELSVHKHSIHIFSTSSRSITSSEQLAVVSRLLNKKFPSFEGYTIFATHWQCPKNTAPCEEGKCSRLIPLTA